MDQTTAELIAELCMRAGALMEDRSADLVSAVPSDVAVRATHRAARTDRGGSRRLGGRRADPDGRVHAAPSQTPPRQSATRSRMTGKPSRSAASFAR